MRRISFSKATVLFNSTITAHHLFSNTTLRRYSGMPFSNNMLRRNNSEMSSASFICASRNLESRRHLFSEAACGLGLGFTCLVFAAGDVIDKICILSMVILFAALCESDNREREQIEQREKEQKKLNEKCNTRIFDEDPTCASELKARDNTPRF